MAQVNAKKTERGTALVEGLPALLCLMIFVSGLLLSAYLIFARSWIQYQSEQALYCLAESRSYEMCRRKMEQKLDRALPFGQTHFVRLSGGGDLWKVDVRWKIHDFEIKIRKQLSVRQILRSRALRSSV